MLRKNETLFLKPELDFFMQCVYNTLVKSADIIRTGMKYPVYLEKDADSDFGVVVPDLPGCYSAGETCDAALENAEEAILTHIEGLMLDKEPIPSPGSIEEHKKIYKSNAFIWALVHVDMSRLSQETKRVNIIMPVNILSKIDAYADKEGETRSGLLATATMEYISRHS
jgi:predicted RNase H-like HicB family nuclease